jgi:hypothetical protein
MQRSMNGRALSFESREMRAFSSYMRWLSTGVPDGAKLLGAGTLQIKEPARAADPRRGPKSTRRFARHVTGPTDWDSTRKMGSAISFRRFGGQTAGAGMSRLLTVAAYAMHNMPLGTTFNVPVLTDEQPTTSPDSSSARIGRKRRTSTTIFRFVFKSPSTLHTGLMRTAFQRNSTCSVHSVQYGPR